LKIHKNSHSYNSKYKGTQFEKKDCKKCDYTCKIFEDMEVHIGKGCLHLLECGLCDDKFDKTDDLEMLLNTCQIYECNVGECLLILRSLKMKMEQLCINLKWTGLTNQKLNSHIIYFLRCDLNSVFILSWDKFLDKSFMSFKLILVPFVLKLNKTSCICLCSADWCT
jgi:hypothetical protein